MLNAGTALIKNVSAGDEFYISFFFKPTNTGAFSLVQFRFGANVLIDIKRNASFFLEVYRGTTLIATGTAVLDRQVHHLQIHAKIEDTSGIVQVKVADALPWTSTFPGIRSPGPTRKSMPSRSGRPRASPMTGTSTTSSSTTRRGPEERTSRRSSRPERGDNSMDAFGRCELGLCGRGTRIRCR